MVNWIWQLVVIYCSRWTNKSANPSFHHEERRLSGIIMRFSNSFVLVPLYYITVVSDVFQWALSALQWRPLNQKLPTWLKCLCFYLLRWIHLCVFIWGAAFSHIPDMSCVPLSSSHGYHGSLWPQLQTSLSLHHLYRKLMLISQTRVFFFPHWYILLSWSQRLPWACATRGPHR